MYRNVKVKKPLTRASIRSITFRRPRSDIPVFSAVLAYVRVPRSWQSRAGQYVYLCIPGTGITAFTQLHPFYVAWYHHDSDGDYLVLIIHIQNGFSKTLLSYASSDGMDNWSTMRAFIEGPYGKELHLDTYGTVLLFATGIGIAGQLPYITQLLEGYDRSDVKARRIALFWELEDECMFL
jgi:predicted ferric reductase